MIRHPTYDFISDTFVANDGGGRDNDPSDPGDWTIFDDCFGNPVRNSSWHGTHVAGTIGAASNNGQGVARDMDAAAGWVFKALRAGYGFALKTTRNNTKWRSRAFRRSLQKRLRDAGYYSGQIDGLFGPGTKRAIKAAFRRQQ